MSKSEEAWHAAAPTVTRWWWIRHAPVFGGASRLYGQEDLDCDVSDTPRYEALASRLPDDAVWIVTNLVRTHQTAGAIWSAAGSEQNPTVEPELAEQFFGDWQGLTWSQMEERDADTYAQFWQDPSGNAPPGGESFAAVIDRTSQAVDRLTQQFAGRDIVCVAHGGSIRGAVSQALGLHHERGLSLTIDNLSLTRLDHIEGGTLNGAGQSWRVVGVNTVV
ncbi:MAG: histidine phosphatase family protein [Rhodospirillales bacterium]|jgi:alpha-ribazole phosphatase|nr:histidine phosphatase family protein [Rhodospirillales bacterium]MBT4040142.1 histidine phosphatase family protein [Rhodospirillales bacterium]MBT4625473.1 histidine phosphatase family protein [Rhodospirillales bacterium]MBT5352111.1 histidine phosphatase family protein [Rhodospirillales bacterium]MBT5521880.1 histidine phosphatase family protein [Rhodospirillales bacterium]